MSSARPTSTALAAQNSTSTAIRRQGINGFTVFTWCVFSVRLFTPRAALTGFVADFMA
jgi:hypothetical protein